jgi:pyridoxal 5'-phosphate synthase pdxS subunit
MESVNGGTEAYRIKVGLAEMLKGGVIMDVMSVEQAKIAEEAGAVAVMALERIPSRIRREGGVARMSDPRMIREIEAAVSIPVMAKCRIGHVAEAQILEVLGVDFVDESEVLTPADEEHHIDKHRFKVPFVCGCRDLGEALRRIGEGAAMIRTKGEAGTGNVVEAVRHMRSVQRSIRLLAALPEEELMREAKGLGAPYELVRDVARTGKLPVPNFAAGGVATPADAALLMQLGAQAVFVGSGIFEVGLDQRPEELRAQQLEMAKAIVGAVTNYDRPEVLAKLSEGLPKPMRGLSMEVIPDAEQLAKRGW